MTNLSLHSHQYNKQTVNQKAMGSVYHAHKTNHHNIGSLCWQSAIIHHAVSIIVKTTVHAHTHTHMQTYAHKWYYMHNFIIYAVVACSGPTTSCTMPCSASYCTACDLRCTGPTEVNPKTEKKVYVSCFFWLSNNALVLLVPLWVLAQTWGCW